jgi:hypothetical protein
MHTDKTRNSRMAKVFKECVLSKHPEQVCFEQQVLSPINCVTEILKKPQLLTWVDSNFHVVLPTGLNVQDNRDDTQEIIQKIKHFYFGNEHLSKDTLPNYIEVSQHTFSSSF